MLKFKFIPLTVILLSLVSCWANPQNTTSTEREETPVDYSTSSQDITTTIEDSSYEQSIEESSTEDTSDDTTSSDAVSRYYTNLNENLTGENLKTNLYNIIKDPDVTSYDGLYSAYYKTDCKPDGVHVWDMYSNCNYTLGVDECHGNYEKEGDNYNREHTIPQSIFNKKSPMVSDIFHVYPTDSKVNGMRSDYPHATVSSATYTSTNGTKIGTSAISNISGKVCEPIDEYKGDFARTYFYFVTCYQDKMPNLSFAAFSMNTYPSLAKWAIRLYLEWSEDDPVSEKEINRNNEGYKVQGNRNPFIDFPGIEKNIWSA